MVDSRQGLVESLASQPVTPVSSHTGLPFVSLLLLWGGTGLNKTGWEAVLGWSLRITAGHMTFSLSLHRV